MANTQVDIRKSAPAPAGGMFDPWRSFRGDMDRMFDRFARGFGLPSLQRMFESMPAPRAEGGFAFTAPAVDVTEDATGYRITAELPGMSEKDIDVSLSGDMLVIKGEKRQEREEKEQNYYLSERSYGSFQRAFTLPEGTDRDRISAEFSKGVLTLTLPKTEQAQQQKKIEVKGAA